MWGDEGRPVREKALVYITHGARLLIMLHPDAPEAGIQVPGGSLKAGEDYGEAALREATEETGLRGLRLGVRLGRAERDMADFGRAHIQRRTFYHVWCMDTPPERWTHYEDDPSEGGDKSPIVLAFEWVRLADGVPPLIAGQDVFIPALIAHLQAEGIV